MLLHAFLSSQLRDGYSPTMLPGNPAEDRRLTCSADGPMISSDCFMEGKSATLYGEGGLRAASATQGQRMA